MAQFDRVTEPFPEDATPFAVTEQRSYMILPDLPFSRRFAAEFSSFSG